MNPYDQKCNEPSDLAYAPCTQFNSTDSFMVDSKAFDIGGFLRITALNNNGQQCAMQLNGSRIIYRVTKLDITDTSDNFIDFISIDSLGLRKTKLLGNQVDNVLTNEIKAHLKDKLVSRSISLFKYLYGLIKYSHLPE